MALVHGESSPIIKSNLDLFSLPPSEVSITSSKWIEFKNISNLVDTPSSLLEFEIPASDSYYDLAESFLYMVVEAKSGDGKALTLKDNVYGTNLFMHSLISQVDLYLNNYLISSASNCYAYRAFLETILGYSHSYAACQGSTALYEYNAHPAVFGNDSIKILRDTFLDSKKTELLGRLHLDMFSQDRYLLNNVSMRIVITLNNNEFVFNEEPVPPAPATGTAAPADAKKSLVNARYYIREASFHIRKQNVTPSVKLAHETQLLSGNTAKYLLNHVIIKRFSIAQGENNFSLTNMFSGQVPSRLNVIFVESDAVNGHPCKNPFLFQLFEITELVLSVDGENTPYGRLLFQYDDNLKKSLIPFQHLLTSVGIAYDSEIGLSLDRNSFSNGFAIFGFDINQSDTSDVGLPLLRSGDCRLSGVFKSALKSSINAIVLGEIPSVLEINMNRQIIFDYAT